MKLFQSSILIIMLLVVSCVYGQEAKIEKERTNFSAKIYAVSTIQGSLYSGTIIDIPKTFSPSISWGKEFGNYNEVELTNLRFQKNNTFKDIEIGIKYSYNWRLFNKSETSRFSYYLGAGVGTLYNRNKHNMEAFIYGEEGCDYGYWTSTNNRYEASISVIPRVNYRISKRLYLDLNLPYDIYSYSSSTKRVDDNHKFTNSNSTAFPNKFTVNVGVAIKF